MPKFTVHMEASIGVSVTVEAEDVEAALEACYDEVPRSICAQCSGWGEDWGKDEGEYEPVSIYDENNTQRSSCPPSLRTRLSAGSGATVPQDKPEECAVAGTRPRNN